MGTIFVFSLGCVILAYVHGSVYISDEDCETDFLSCKKFKNDLSTCQTSIGKCIRSQHHRADEMIPTIKQDFMKKFKCCFQHLSVCIKEESKKKDIELRRCSTSMLGCAMGKKTKREFRKESPIRLREMFGKYGVCIRRRCLNDCVKQYYVDMEDLLGMDCLNKYIHCAYSSKDGKRSTCHMNWKKCMVPTCKDSSVSQLFETRLIKGIWLCQKDASGENENDKHVFDTLRCILELYKDGTTMSALLTKEHIRESCFLVYGQDNYTFKRNFELCVKHNSN